VKTTVTPRTLGPEFMCGNTTLVYSFVEGKITP